MQLKLSGDWETFSQELFLFFIRIKLVQLVEKIQVLELDPIFLPLASLLSVFGRCKQETCTDSII